MNMNLHCLALRHVAVSDSRSLLSAWSRELGRITLAFPSATSREGRRRRALTPPMALFEGVAEVRPGREVLAMRDLSPQAGSVATAMPSPARAATAAVLAEMLDLLLRRSEADIPLDDCLNSGAMALATASGEALAAFAPVFLFRITRHMGICPDMESYAPGRVFDMREGRFRTSLPLHEDYVDTQGSALLAALAAADPRQPVLPGVDRLGRRRALELMVRYFSVHLGTHVTLRWLAVLAEFD